MINLMNIQPHKVSRDLSGYITYIYGEAKIGKAQPNDTLVPTPSGIKKLGDIKVGDYVFNRMGKPVKVLGVFPQGKLDVYKVILEDGRSTECNDEHLWTYYTSRGNFKTVTLKEMIEKNPEILSANAKVYYKIPNNSPVEYPENENLKVDPYVLGCFLGDGCCKERQLTISSEDEELVAEIAKRLDVKYKKCSDFNYSWKFPLKEKKEKHYNNLDKEYVSTEDIFKCYEKEVMCSAKDKRIPKDYLYGSIEQRFELLRGLMDTDGGFIQSGDYPIKFTTISEQLKNDFIYLCNSLGIRATCVVDNRSEKYTTGKCYAIRLCVSNQDKFKLFNLSRKINIGLKLLDIQLKRNFNTISIRYIKKMNYQKEMTCLYIDDDEHLYLTNDFIVTHNTTLCSKFPKALIIAFERGYNALPGVLVQDVTKWSEFKEIIRELKKPEVKERFSTIVVDTIDVAGVQCDKYICNQLDIDSIGDGGWATNGWAKYKKELEDCFRTITQLGYALVCISHDQDKTFKKKDGTEYNQIVPTAQKSLNNIIKDMADLYLYAAMDENSKQRKLIVRSNDGSIDCGSRFKHMANEIPLNYDELIKALNEAIDKEAKEYDNQFVTDEKIQPISKETELDFNELINEFGNIVKELMNDNQNNSIKITNIVDKYLGKGKKVSDCTPTQSEQLELILGDLRELLKTTRG